MGEVPADGAPPGAQDAGECLHLLSPHFADVHVMSFRISAYAQYQVTPNHLWTPARSVHTADQRFVVQAVRYAFLGFQDADAVDELESDRRYGPCAVSQRRLSGYLQASPSWSFEGEAQRDLRAHGRDSSRPAA
jgi:hypothetical protein